MTGSDPLTRSTWEIPALALARWTALFMGWVWLGQQGQRLSWTLASGLTAVALWWAVRLLAVRWPGWRIGSSRSGLLTLGLTTATGAMALSQASAGTPALLGLLTLAAVWGAWTAALDSLSLATQRCPCPWAGWPPLLAALTTWVAVAPWAVSAPEGLVAGAVLLAATTLAWSAAPGREPASPRLCAARRSSATHLPGTAMGCMMGSLWLSNAWCTSVGWSSHTVVGLHLALMAVMPALVRLDGLPRHLPPTANRLLPLIGVAAGSGLLWAGQTLAHGVVGMLLLAMAWALPTPSRQPATAAPPAEWLQWAPLLGPALLFAVGHWSPSSGPEALAWVYGVLAAWAATWLLRDGLQAVATYRQTTRPQH
jgi:hypothetical protein